MSEIIEKTIKLDDTKLLRVKAVLGEFRSDCLDYDRAELFVTNPVEVISEDYRRLGWATVYLDGLRLMADLVLDYASPERLSYENGEQFFARAQGLIEYRIGHELEQRGNLDFRGLRDRLQVWDVMVHRILITSEGEGLEPIGAVL